jgi:hypothetical protein
MVHKRSWSFGGWEGVRNLVYILSATDSYNKYLFFGVRFAFILQ